MAAFAAAHCRALRLSELYSRVSHESRLGRISIFFRSASLPWAEPDRPQVRFPGLPGFVLTPVSFLSAWRTATSAATSAATQEGSPNCRAPAQASLSGSGVLARAPCRKKSVRRLSNRQERTETCRALASGMTLESNDQRTVVERADAEIREERLLAAARLLRRVTDESVLQKKHWDVLEQSTKIEEAVSDLLSTPSADHGWHRQGQSHGCFDSSIYYKIETGAKLTCRMETPVPSSLLVPLLSVLNESALYKTWITHWTKPVRLGIRESKKLVQESKGRQIIQVKVDVPWPLSSREVVIDAQAVDDIDERGFIAVNMKSLDDATDPAEFPTAFRLPRPEGRTERVSYNGAILFRACPEDHPNHASARQRVAADEDLVLLQFKIHFDAHIAMLPRSVINFVTRTAIGTVWSTFLRVAVQVRDGTRPDDLHQRAIGSQPEFYQWVQDRVQVMLNGLKEGEGASSAACLALSGRCRLSGTRMIRSSASDFVYERSSIRLGPVVWMFSHTQTLLCLFLLMWIRVRP